MEIEMPVWVKKQGKKNQLKMAVMKRKESKEKEGEELSSHTGENAKAA